MMKKKIRIIIYSIIGSILPLFIYSCSEGGVASTCEELCDRTDTQSDDLSGCNREREECYLDCLKYDEFIDATCLSILNNPVSEYIKPKEIDIYSCSENYMASDCFFKDCNASTKCCLNSDIYNTTEQFCEDENGNFYEHKLASFDFILCEYDYSFEEQILELCIPQESLNN